MANLESELLATVLPAAIGAGVGGLIVLLGSYRLRRWELMTQYRISNIQAAYVPLSHEISNAIKAWTERSIRISGISTDDTTPFVPEPSTWKRMEKEGTVEIIRFSDPHLFRRIQSYYQTHYAAIAELRHDFIKARDELKSEWADEILEYQDPQLKNKDPSIRAEAKHVAQRLLQEVGDRLFVNHTPEEIISTLREAIKFIAEQRRQPQLRIQIDESIPQTLYEKATTKVRRIHLGIERITQQGFLKDAEGLLEMIRTKIGKPV